MKAREYQSTQTEQVSVYSSLYRKLLIQLPTGGGKTVEFCLITQKFLRTGKGSVLILVHRQELMKQAQKTIKAILGIDAVLITSQSKRYRISQVYIGMVESTVRRLDLFHNVGMVIIDECHMANFNKVHSLFLEEMILGFSATPVSSSKKEPLNRYYSKIITGPQIKELIELGYLSQNITRCPKDIVDSTQFQIDKLKGDYNERQMADEYKAAKHIVNVVKSYKKYSFNKKTLIFNVNIDHSKEVNALFNDLGIESKHLDSNCTDEERAEILHWFKVTPNAVLNNVAITTVGFDEPTVQTVILNYSTLSLTKYIQTCGRGSRRIDEELAQKLLCKPKSYFNIIDMGGNCIRFGDWNDDRDWEYIFTHPDKPGEGVAPVKTCPNCEGLVHAAIMLCPLTDQYGEICNYEFKRKVGVEKDLEEMILITKGINVDELIGKHKKKYQYYTFLDLGHDIVRNMVDKYGDNISESFMRKSFKAYYQLCIQWYEKTMSGKDGNIDDISDSGWHLKRARNNFNDLVKRYSKTKTFIQDEIPYSWNKEEFINLETSSDIMRKNQLSSLEN